MSVGRWPLLLPAALLLVACPAARPLPPTPMRPKVVVAVVVDQLAAWEAEERLPRLPETGGFARLRREGAWVLRLDHDHATTDTAPGHARLFTGAPPAVSGIVANEQLLPGPPGKAVSVLRDEQVQLVGLQGPEEARGSSLAALRVETLADVVRREVPGAFIASFSLKDRGALPGAGRHPDVALWFDPARQGFVTSTAFAQRLPLWATALAAPETVKARAVPWEAESPAWLAEQTGLADDAPGEGDLEGYGTTFPHDPERSRQPGKAFRAHPGSDALLVDLGLAALSNRPADAPAVLLTLSFSAHDYVGHIFGAGSWESWELLRRLDGELARLMEGLDGQFGADGWSLLLSADHGATPLPESLSLQASCRQGSHDPFERACTRVGSGRLIPHRLGEGLERAAEAVLGKGPWVQGVVDPLVELTPLGLALEGARREQLLAALEAHLRSLPEVGGVTRVDAPAATEGVARLVSRSVVKGRGVLHFWAALGAHVDPEYVEGKGGGHGSPRPHDRLVPLLVRAPEWVLPGVRVTGPLPSSVYVRTAAALMDVPPPNAAEEGEPLTSSSGLCRPPCAPSRR